MNKPWEYVEVFADLDFMGRLPTDAAHVHSRGARPDIKNDITNIVGLNAETHREQHDGKVKIPARHADAG